MTALALAGRLVTTAGILDGGVLEVRLDGTIGYVGPASGWSGPVPEPVDTVAPGYVDIHCHGGGSHTVTSRDPAEVAAVAAHHLSRGTTTMLASLVSASAPELVAAITAIASVAATGSPIVGCHVEGPFLDPAHRGAHDPAHLRLPGSDELATWLAAGVDDAGRPRVRMVTLAPELPGAAAAAEMPDGDFELGSVRVRVADGRAWTRTEPSSLAGGTSHAADLVRRCVMQAGVDPVAAVAAATSTPAALFGLDDRGSLATGLRADLVVLDRDWRVRRVMCGGDWV